jgi:NADH:ubiquinone oxidoreductase subunit E
MKWFFITIKLAIFIAIISPEAMLHKRKIVICLGSSCFARGNQELIPVIRKYIASRQIEDKVDFKGDHCLSNCSEGPNLMIDSRLYEHITIENIETMLDEGLSDL